MQDFLTWFLQKHYFAAAFLFPEVSFAWAVWMRWYWWSAVCLVNVLCGNYTRNATYSGVKEILRKL